MRPHAIRNCLFTFALLLIGRQVVAAEAASLPAATADAMAQAASPQAIAEYRRKLAGISRRARGVRGGGRRLLEFDRREAARPQRQAARAGSAIELDDYVLTQPPVYAGPPRPVNPEPSAPEPQEPRRERKYIPVVADLLKAAAEHFQFAPQQPANDLEFKRAYAR